MTPQKFREHVALFLNEHPDFFNEFPELLTRIKTLETKDFPLGPTHALSVADPLIQRVRDDREHLKDKLEWFMELARNNEKIHEHLYEIERLALGGTELLPMLSQFQAEIKTRFDIQYVTMCLADGIDPFEEAKLKKRYPTTLDGALRFVKKSFLDTLFDAGASPLLRSEIEGESMIFTAPKILGSLQSEAIVPIEIRNHLIGCIAFGSQRPFHFYEELCTGFLSRMAGKLAIAIDNILFLDELKQRSLVDPVTHHYNSFYLEPVLVREFDRARRYKKNLSTMMMSIDYFENLSHTKLNPEENDVLMETGALLNQCCRAMDIIIRYDDTKFFLLLPETSYKSAFALSQRIQQKIEAHHFDGLDFQGKPRVTFGLASFPRRGIHSHRDLIQKALLHLALSPEEKDNRLASA